MAITRTAKGTASSKAATTSLTISSVSMVAGDALVVGIAYETDAALDSVKFGGREMKWVADSGITQGDTRVRIYRAKIKKTRTADITATWASNMSARAMFATSIHEASAKDVGSTNTNTATTDPGTGTAVTSTAADTISIAAFASLGPSTDTAGTAGSGHTLGQRVGTTGAPPLSNVTIQETYEILSATGNIRATMTGATARDWANTIVAFEASQTYIVDRAAYLPFDGNHQSESVIFVMEDETTSPQFTIAIPRADFEEMTDQEVTDYIAGGCQWWDGKVRDSDPSPDFTPDATFNTRVSSFENDEFVV